MEFACVPLQAVKGWARRAGVGRRVLASYRCGAQWQWQNGRAESVRRSQSVKPVLATPPSKADAVPSSERARGANGAAGAREEVADSSHVEQRRPVFGSPHSSESTDEAPASSGGEGASTSSADRGLPLLRALRAAVVAVASAFSGRAMVAPAPSEEVACTSPSGQVEGGARASAPAVTQPPETEEVKGEDGGAVRAAAAPQSRSLTVTTSSSIHEFDRDEWDACARSGDEVSPFVLWDFFAALEDSGSTCAGTGWQPWHLSLRAPDGSLLAVVPMFIKGHSYGEYVFDHAWANLYARLGQRYYPKLQCAVPFTPVTGPRILIAPAADRDEATRTVLRALPEVAASLGVSSLHMTFNTEAESEAARRSGWLSRVGIQFHWENGGYATFDDFLATLKQSKRKSIRQERKSIAKQGLRIERLTGERITPEIWASFYRFYRNTTDRKWGTAYLTRDFFTRLGSSMADRTLLVVAYDDNKDGELVAAALNMIGSRALFGRNWGCLYPRAYKNLHFELCYYQAIEAAIEMKLDRVEAGAQGEHKIARGYLPTTTYSSHVVRNEAAADLITTFLRREAVEMSYTIDALTAAASPYKDCSASVERAFEELRAHAAASAADQEGDSD